MKKSFAKYIALFLAAMFTFSCAGCGKEKAEQKEPVIENEESTENTEEKEAEGYLLKDAFMTAEGAPELTASAAILIEESTGTILYGKNED